MSSAKVDEYLIYRKVVKKMLFAAGAWPIENPSLIYRSIPYIQTGLSLVMAYFIFGFVQTHSNNIASLIRGLSIMTTFFSVALKMTCFIIYHQERYSLHELLDVYFDKLIQTSEFTQPILENVTIFRGLTIALTFFVVYNCGSWILLPLYHNIQQYSHHVQSPKYALIFPTKYPWNIPATGFIFHLHFIFESLASVALCLITLCVDSLFAFYIFQMTGQLREISKCIVLVDETNNNKNIIRKCVTQYEKLIKCRDMVQKIYGPLILWTMGTNAVILCTVMFQITNSESISKGRMGLLGTYISVKILQTFMYAWSGSQLTVESEDYGTSVYCAKWYGNKSYMKSIVIMLTQRPLILSACNFSTVSLNIFVMILKTTMSYFFLLQALDETDS